MHQSHTYAVSNGKAGPTKPPKPKERLECSIGMSVGCTLGVIAILFMVYVYGIPNNITPKHRNLYKDMIPIVKQGNLALYPWHLSYLNNPARNDSFYITLPPTNIAQTIKDLQRLHDAYPKQRSENYTQCWVENSQYNKPCFFDFEWVGSECSFKNNFGYDEKNGTFNPCVFLRFEETGKWKPVPNEGSDMPSSTLEHYDAAFVQIYCQPQIPYNTANPMGTITVSPEKGFSVLYFPIARFAPESYLPPLVAIQFNGIPKGATVTVDCSILAQNTLTLDNEGMFTITFVA